MALAVGIDLGTTHSLVAYLDGTAPRLIAGAAGEWLTPSVVARLPGGELVVGLAAQALLATDPSRACANFKRAMGSGELLELAGERYRPEELSAMVLRKLKADAERTLGAVVEEAVITVPAYFTDAQREATKAAGEIAGLRVERILNEPTAAALAYGLANLDAEEHVLVYDLGGGTFDVSVLEMFSGLLDVKSSTGNNRLGGIDFDAALAELALLRARLPGGLAALPERERSVLLQRCERAKRALSDAAMTELRVPATGRAPEGAADGTQELTISISAEDFRLATQTLVAATLVSVDQALTDAKVGKAKLGPIVLVGGSSRMPVVRDALRAHFGKALHDGVHPDHAVALGAALQMGLKRAAIGTQTGIMITDVAPFTLGVEVAHQAGSQVVHGMFTSIIPRNSTVPISRTEKFSTMADGQKMVTIRVFQGESRYTKNNTFLDEFSLDGVPPAPAGKESVAVTFTYDINGILHVSTEIVSTGKKAELTVDRRTGHRMNAAELATARRRVLGSAAETDANRTQVAEAASPAANSSAAAAGAGAMAAGAGTELRAALSALADAAMQRRPQIAVDAHARLDALVARTRSASDSMTATELQALEVEFTDFLFRYS